MANDFKDDVFLSHSAKDKAAVRAVAERLRKDGLRVWPCPPKPPGEGGFDEWVLRPEVPLAHRMGEGSGLRAAKIKEGLEHSKLGTRNAEFGIAQPGMSANAFGSDWAKLEADAIRFRDPLNQERRFLPLRLDDAPIKGSLAQFLYINWLPADREQEGAVGKSVRPVAADMGRLKLKGLKARKKIAQGKRSGTSAALGQRTRRDQALRGRQKFRFKPRAERPHDVH